MPSTSSLLSVCASMSTSIMLFRAMFHQLVPPQVQTYIIDGVKIRTAKPKTAKVDSQSPQNPDAVITKSAKEDQINVGLGGPMEIVDSFEGIRLKELLHRRNSTKDDDGSPPMKQTMKLDHPSTFDTLAMDPKLKKSIIDDLDLFVKRRDFYKKVGKAWKRGYLPPGTGKSSLIAAMANYLKFDIYDLQLSNVQNDSTLKDMFYIRLRSYNLSLYEVAGLLKAFAEATSRFLNAPFPSLGTQIYVGYNKSIRIFDIHRLARDFEQHSTIQGNKEGQQGAFVFANSFVPGPARALSIMHIRDNVERASYGGFVRKSAASMLCGKKHVTTVPTFKKAGPMKTTADKKAAGPSQNKQVAVKDVKPAKMTLEEIVSRLGSLVLEDIITRLKSTAWKERLEAIISFKENLIALHELDQSVEIIIRLLCTVPGWNDKNVQVQQATDVQDTEGFLWMVSAVEDFGVTHLKLKDVINFCKRQWLTIKRLKDELLKNFCDKELISYHLRTIFGIPSELAELDKTGMRYAWVKRRLSTNEETWKIFPTSLHVDYLLCI
ncbi:AAA+ ATPase domain-containing protein [Tanacetum coccineum]